MAVNVARPVSAILNVRNPRNLEWLRIVRKHYGYEGIRNFKGKAFYYRIELEKSKTHTTGLLRHMSDGVVLNASTKEKALSRRLHSCTDISAAVNVGRLLAIRCFKAGVHFANVHLQDLETSAKSRAFFDALKSTGLVLEEFETIEPEYSVDKRYHWVYSDPMLGKDFEA